MSRKGASGVGVLLLALGAWSWDAFDSANAQPEQIVKVSADDLASGKVVVIGRLGIPLATEMTIGGKWRYPPRARN